MSNKIFSVGNKARHGQFVAAPDEEQARQVALASGHVKTLDAARVKDVTIFYVGQPNAAHIIESDRRGVLVKECGPTGRGWLFTWEVRGIEPPAYSLGGACDA